MMATPLRSPSAPATAHERQIIQFPCGIAGFERCRSFVVCSAETAPLQWFQSVDGPAASFLVLDPRLVVPTYTCPLASSDLERLGAGADSSLLWLAVVLIEADGTIAVNLRAPVVINPDTMIGIQVMPQDDAFPLRFVVAPAAGS